MASKDIENTKELATKDASEQGTKGTKRRCIIINFRIDKILKGRPT